MTAPLKTTRIAPGIYDVAHADRSYELERYDDGNWLLFEAPKGEHSPREYMQHFATKGAALAALAATPPSSEPTP